MSNSNKIVSHNQNVIKKIKSVRKRTCKNIRVASFFAGAGGLDLGFHELGYDVVFANEIKALFCETLKANAGTYQGRKTDILNKDIREIKKHELPDNIDLVIGGPPCQSYSASGRRAGGAAGSLDRRGTLFEAYCRVIKWLEPEAFVFENVRGILGTHGGKDWSNITKRFLDIGYETSYRILDACDYGIPQHRERLFLVGHKLGEEFLFPAPIYGPDSKSNNSHLCPSEVFSNIRHDEDLNSLVLVGGKYSHLLSKVPPGDNYLFFTEKRGYPAPVFAYRSRFSDFLYKANPDYPIKTIIASPGKYTGPLHWENRYFSLAEYKKLQGFPDDYVFVGNRADVIKQIGNSVSPIIAVYLAKAIAKQVFGKRIEIELLPSEAKLSFDKRKGDKARKTKDYHKAIETKKNNSTKHNVFKFSEYSERVMPTKKPDSKNNVIVSYKGNNAVLIKVMGDGGRKLIVKTKIVINTKRADLFNQNHDAILDVRVYGEETHNIQTMWNAINSWVIRSSNYHSLFELYGHFTEPHPIFDIVSFEVYSDNPILVFAKHVSNFVNCSQFFPKRHLLAMFSDTFEVNSFTDLVKILRNFRYDIRSHETNIAIQKGTYMVSYPFTLPYSKQMNFSIRNHDESIDPEDKSSLVSYADYVRQ